MTIDEAIAKYNKLANNDRTCYPEEAQHLAGYQHIDLSLKKHGLGSKDNPHGWKVGSLDFPTSELDEMELYYIKTYAALYLKRYKAPAR